ncbi:cob(I)yrinic acid a,c-diamide adenosyltransferase [Polynucleobacter sp. MWH-Loch1C5]|jgi:cob(I)alamin adenosyltransferase|uniref:cob(I)yrinic acid a,c-diamide adenosyltransferase n=1 Tax=Polynucleobacter sp. MWH-Loch1C5 TaxID=2689108 RepID=UPI001C0DDBC6|nr:cob(I)yrinic acid a,c-diamide adenosyltransferase [Polynucleobacter sp. MWH-Loch1C5]MBU3542740.1 cob(I)yrinic acid a,c-diamide adenosyltransferase [Polynucleobacter sp. MWH-Loch1C5]
MGKRLTQIATRTGDAGETGLGDGQRVYKDHLRICAMGDVDELNSHIGLLMTEDLPASVASELKALFSQIQHDLFDLGGELCIPNYTLLKEEQVAQLDVWLKQYNDTLPKLEEFILPGGSRAAAQAHICRTVCRRAERSIVKLGRHEPIHDTPRQYVNRLSDLLFVLARVLNRAAGGADVLWHHKKTAE